MRKEATASRDFCEDCYAKIWLEKEVKNLEGAKITPEELREKGDELRETLHAAAAALEKLTSAGWRPLEFVGPGYELMLTKDISLTDARKEIKGIGLKDFVEKLCLSRKKVLLMKVRPSLRSREH